MQHLKRRKLVFCYGFFIGMCANGEDGVNAFTVACAVTFVVSDEPNRSLLGKKTSLAFGEWRTGKFGSDNAHIL